VRRAKTKHLVFAARCYAEHSYEVACRCMTSVRPSVTIRYRDHIGWNSSKILFNSLRLTRSLTLTWVIWCNGNTPKSGWNQEHIKAAKSPKWCDIEPRLLLQTNRKSHTRFRFVPTSMTLDDLERLKRHSCRNKQDL